MDAAVNGAPLRAISILVMALTLLIAMCDGFDNQALAFTAPAIAGEWGLKMPSFAPVFSAGLFGLMLGSMLFGTLADRLGRRRMMLVSAACFGFATIATPFVSDLNQLMVIRFLGGLGIGGVPSIGVPLVAETTPARWRQSFVAWAFIGVPLGGFFGGLLGSVFIPAFGWRSVYYFGAGATALVFLASIALLPESNRYLALRGADPGRLARLMNRIDPAGAYTAADRFILPAGEDRRSSVANLFTNRRARMTILYWVAMFVDLAIFYFVVNWTPTLFRESGLSVNLATISTAAVNFGGMLFGVVLGRLCDRFGVRNATALTFGLEAAGLLMMSAGDGLLAPMMVGAFLAGSGAIGGASALTMFGGESYPTALRSTGIGWALAAGRIGSIISPWVVSIPLQAGWHAQHILLLPVIPALIGAVCILLSRGARPELAASADSLAEPALS